MKNPSHAKALYRATMGVSLLLYVAFGIFGYLVYGEKVEGSITLNLTGHSVGTVM